MINIIVNDLSNWICFVLVHKKDGRIVVQSNDRQKVIDEYYRTGYNNVGNGIVTMYKGLQQSYINIRRSDVQEF